MSSISAPQGWSQLGLNLHEICWLEFLKICKLTCTRRTVKCQLDFDNMFESINYKSSQYISNLWKLLCKMTLLFAFLLSFFSSTFIFLSALRSTFFTFLSYFSLVQRALENAALFCCFSIAQICFGQARVLVGIAIPQNPKTPRMCFALLSICLKAIIIRLRLNTSKLLFFCSKPCVETGSVSS